MLCVALPFRREEPLSGNDNFGGTGNRTYMRKCRTQLLQAKQLHSRHPFQFQILYFKKFSGLYLEKEAYENTMKIKYLSLREGFSFPEFLSLCQNDHLLFDEEMLTSKNLKLQFDQSSDTISQISSVSLMNQSTISKGNEQKSEYAPQINLKKFVTMLKQEHRPLEEIEKDTEALVTKAIANLKKRLLAAQINAHNTMQLSQEKPAPTYKLPKFSSKGFLACPRELRREIIEFQESNSEKPYPGLILALAYFYGISDRIQRNQSLGFKYLEKITKEYPYFAQAQSIQVGLKSGDHLEAEAMEFLLNGISPNSNSDSEMNYLFNDDLPFFFDSQSSNCVPKVFASLDQINQPVDKLVAVASRQENIEIKELFSIFARFIKSNSSAATPSAPSSDQNLISNSLLKQNNPPPPTHALFDELIKPQTHGIKKSSLELWMNAANMNHLGAITRLSVYLLENISTISGQLKEQLEGYVKKGCELLLPACLKIQIYLQIMGDASMQDFEGAYQNMKHLFFLGSDCFKIDLMRLAKHFKDYSFLALYCTYLKNIKDPNANICVGLLKEKGYGMKKDLEGALAIYDELKEKKKVDIKSNFDMPLSYRLGKVLHALGRNDEANIQFKAILQFYKVSKQNSLDIVCLYKIGKLYEKGLGCNQSIDFALRIYQRILSDGTNDEQNISRQTTAFTSNLSNSLMNDDQLIGSRFLQKPKKTEKIWEKLTKQLDVKDRLNYWKQQPSSLNNDPLRGIYDIDPSEFVGLPKVLEAQSTEQLPEIADAFEDESSDQFSLIETTSQLEQIFDEFSDYERISHNMLTSVNYYFSTSSNAFSIQQS